MKLLNSIQAKVTIGLSVMVILVLLSASLGLNTIKSLEEQLNAITDEAGPTVEETDDLIANLWESAKVANEILASEDLAEVEILAKELEELHSSYLISAKNLQEIVDTPENLGLISLAVNEHSEFIIHTKDMIKAHQMELEEEIKAKRLLNDFDGIGEKMITMLDEFATENEQEMQKAEDQGDYIVENNGSAASVNDVLGELFEKDYPVVEASLKLQRIVLEMQDTSGEYLSQEDPTLLKGIKQEFDIIVEISGPHFIVLSTLAETEEDKQDFITLKETF